MRRLYYSCTMILTGLLISTQLFGQKMSGSYVIGTGGDYTTIQAAVDAMQTKGISAPVVFNIKDGSYAENVVINDTIDGSSATNTITFQSQSNDSSKVKISVASGICFSSTTNAGNIIFNNMSFEQTGPSATSLVNFDIDVLTEPVNIKLNKCYIRALNNVGANMLYIRANDRNIKSVVIDKCIIKGGNRSISIMTNSNDFNNDETISGVSVTNTSLTDGILVESVMDVYNLTISNVIYTRNIPSYNGVYIYSGYGSVKDVRLNKLKLTTMNDYAVYVYANQSINRCTVDSSIIASTASNGIYLYANNENATGLNLKNSSLRTYYLPYYVYANNDIDTLNFYNDSLFINTDYNRTMEIYAYGSMKNVSMDKFYSYASGNYRYGPYFYASGSISNMTVSNSKSFAYYNAFDINANRNIMSVSFSNDSIKSTNSTALYFDADMQLSDVSMDKLRAIGQSYGIEFYGYSKISKAVFNRSSMVGSNYGLYAYSDLLIHNLAVTNCKYKALGGNYIYSDVSLDSISFDRDSIVSDQSTYMLEIYASYNSINNVSITNSKIQNEGSTIIYVYANNELNNLVIENDSLIKGSLASTWGYALDIESYLGQVNNAFISSNIMEIRGNGYGIYMYIPGKNVRIVNNKIYAPAPSLMNYAIYAQGESGLYSNNGSLTIANNTIGQLDSYGIYLEYLNGSNKVQNNTITTKTSSGMYGVYTYYVKGKKLEISGNTISNSVGYSNSNAPLYFDWETMPDTGLVYNNMLSGVFDYGVYLYGSSNMNILNNSFSIMLPDSNYVMNSIQDISTKNNRFENNIFSMYGSEGKMYGIDNYSMITNNVFKNNMYNRKKDSVSFVYMYYSGDYIDSLSIWQKSQKKDSLSFNKKPDFVNDTTNLHIKCGSTGYNVASKQAVVAYDIDGQTRTATPTIGADEVLSGTSNVSYAAKEICGNTPIVLDAGYFAGATYTWNNSKTGQTISVSAPGTYTVNITGSGCGTIAGSFSVKAIQPVADFTSTTSYLTAIFTNNSKEFTSLEWNFGDGTKSTVENPIHLYSANGSYTATLTVYSYCDTVTKSVSINMNYVDVKEVLENASIYPNPAVDQVTLAFGSTVDQALVQIFSLDGAQMASLQVINAADVNCSLAGYPAGIYLVKITAAEHTITRKLIKE